MSCPQSVRPGDHHLPALSVPRLDPARERLDVRSRGGSRKGERCVERAPRTSRGNSWGWASQANSPVETISRAYWQREQSDMRTDSFTGNTNWPRYGWSIDGGGNATGRVGSASVGEGPRYKTWSVLLFAGGCDSSAALGALLACLILEEFEAFATAGAFDLDDILGRSAIGVLSWTLGHIAPFRSL